MERLTENVFVESGHYPTGSFVTTPEGVVAIDGLMDPALAVAWAGEMAARGPVRYLIHTEHHADHIAANAFLGGTVVASEWTRDHFLGDVEGPESPAARIRGRYPDAAPLLAGYRLRTPEIAFSGRLTIGLGGRTFRLRHLPGHTPGQVVVHAVEEGVVFPGDTVVNAHPPFFHDAWAPGWLEALERVAALGAEWIVPGHGPPCRPEHARWLRGFLLELIGEVRAARDRGLSREAAQGAVRYIDRPEFHSPRLERVHLERLERASVGVIWDQLDALPAG